MRRCCSDERYREGRNPQAVENDGGIVEIAQYVHAEGVHQSMAYQQGCIDADYLRWRRFKASFDRC